MSSNFFCGASKKDITPEEDELSGLFGLMGTPYAGIIDRLSVRVIAVKSGETRAMIISFDLDKAPEPAQWIPELVEKTGIPEENILYFGTHTHSAPLTTIRPRERNSAAPEQREAMNRYEEVLKKKLFEAVDEAWACVRTARLGYAKGNSYVNVNRNADFVYTDESGNRFPFINEAMNWGAPVDRTAYVLRIEDLEGTPIAFFMNYAMHCCLMFLNNYDGRGSMGISGDIAGNVSRLTEEKFPGAVAVWSSGAAGDVDPVLFNASIYPDPKDGHVVNEPFTDWRATAQMLRMIVGWHFKDLMEIERKIICDQTEVPIRTALEWSRTPKTDGSEYAIRMQALQLGDFAMAGIGGELYNSLGRGLISASPVKDTVVINHNASLIDDAGYILDDDTLERARISKEAPGRHMIPGGRSGSVPGTVGPSIEEHIRHMLG